MIFVKFGNFNLVELVLNVNIFNTNFTHVVFGRNGTIWPPVPVEIRHSDF